MHEVKQEKESSIQYGYDILNDNVVLSQIRGQLIYIDVDYLKRLAYGLLGLAEEIEVLKRKINK